MKRLFTLICLCVLAASTSWAQQLYTEFVVATGTLTYYYDDQMSSRSGVKEVYDQSKGLSISYESDVLKAVIDPSMKDAPLTSTYRMFWFLKNMVRIEGLANLNTANVKNMSSMFYGCSALTSLNLSSFNTANVTDMRSMFWGCNALWSLDVSSFNTANVTNMGTMFSYCESLTSLNLSSFNTAKVTNMASMFSYCSSLTSLNLSSFNTAQVWSMNEMFCACSSLTSLNLSSFNTTNVSSMEGMFSYCRSLTSLNLSSFNTAQVTSMSEMFRSCRSLTSLDLISFNTAMVTNMSKMFSGCDSLTSLDLISFNTAKVTDMSNMFYYCSSLTSLDLISFNTAKVTDMSEMFKYCNNLTTIFCDDDWSTSSVLASSNDMFYDCNALVGGKGTKYESYHITNETYARPDGGTSKPGYFTGGLPEYGIFVASSNPTTGLEYDFINATEFVFDDELAAYVATVGTEGNPASWVSRVMISNVRGRENRFKAATVMTSGMINGTEHTWLNYTETPNAEILLPAAGVWRIALDDYNRKINFYQIEGDEILEVYTEFDEATGTLTYYYDLNMSSRLGVTELYDPVGNPEAVRFDGYNDKVHKAVIDPSMKDAPLTSMMRMFYGNQKSSELRNMETIEGLENLNTAIVTDMSQMFYGCQSLTSLGLSSFNTANVTDMTSMFYGCNALTSLDLSSFNTANVTDMSQMFSRCQYLTSLVISSFNTGNVTDMSGMFENCNDLTSLNLSSFNTENVTSMLRIFYNCSNLKVIFCNYDWSTSSVLKYSSDMFMNCNALVGGKGTKFDTNVTDVTYARPDGGTSKPGYFTEKTAEVYTEFAEATGTLTFYYDTKRSSRSGVTEVYDPAGHPDAVRFTGYDKQVLKAVIDPSMKDAPLTSMKGMFYGGMNTETYQFQTLSNMTAIEGMENLNTANATSMNNMFGLCQSLTAIDLSSFNTENVTDMEGMFMGCNKLQTLDVSTFNVSNVANMSMMFGSCMELTTIYCNSDWSIIAKSDYMFSGCTKLVGGQGTTFDSSVTNADYARPDYGFPQRGYFTRIAIRCPDGLATETYAFKGRNVYYSEDEFSEVQIGFADATTVYIQGLSKVLPEAWLKGTLIGNTLAIPETYMGIFTTTDGDWSEDYEIMFLGTTFTYDSEAGTFTSSYYATNDGYDLADEYRDVTLTKLADVAATPADPEITWFYYLDSKDPGIDFNISTVDTEGNPLITKKMAYVILYIDGEGISPLVLTKDLYPELEADRTEQPITNYFTRQEGIYRSSLSLKQSPQVIDSWRMVGIQSVYYGGGERRTSKIAWFTNPTADGIDDINGQESRVEGQPVFNLAGQRLSKPAKGINIIGGRKMIK